jgi:hypothetical protein
MIDPRGKIGQERGSLNSWSQMAVMAREVEMDPIFMNSVHAVLRATYPRSRFFAGFNFNAVPILKRLTAQSLLEGFTSRRGPHTTMDSLVRAIYGVGPRDLVATTVCTNPDLDEVRRYRAFDALMKQSRLTN